MTFYLLKLNIEVEIYTKDMKKLAISLEPQILKETQDVQSIMFLIVSR